MSGGSRTHKKHNFCRVLARFWVILAASRQVKKWCQKRENRCPTGSRLNPGWPKVVAKFVPRLDPDWIPIGFQLVFFSKNASRAPISKIWAPIFLKFEHLAVPPPVLSQIQANQYIYIYASKKLFAQIWSLHLHTHIVIYYVYTCFVVFPWVDLLEFNLCDLNLASSNVRRADEKHFVPAWQPTACVHLWFHSTLWSCSASSKKGVNHLTEWLSPLLGPRVPLLGDETGWRNCCRYKMLVQPKVRKAESWTEAHLADSWEDYWAHRPKKNMKSNSSVILSLLSNAKQQHWELKTGSRMGLARQCWETQTHGPETWTTQESLTKPTMDVVVQMQNGGPTENGVECE